ncbi:MAG: sugar phosphate nucleotidyltransferase, partial [Nitrospirota bacterium]
GNDEIKVTSKKDFQVNQINVFILAAGFGERLRPITDYIPKPLIPILGKPVLQTILEKVSNLPVNKIGINLRHKKEFIENWIKQSAFSKKVEIFYEDPILGTGGALKNAETFLSSNIFLVHNSDIISDIDLEKLVAFHLSSGNLVTLAVHDCPEFNNLEIDEKGFLKGVFRHPHLNPPLSSSSPCGLRRAQSSRRGQRGGGTAKCIAFTGIAIYSPEFLKFLPSGASNVVDAWLRAVESGYRVGTFDVSGCYWADIGTPVSYAKAVIDELRKDGEMVYIHPSVDWCNHVEFNGYVVIEGGTNISHGISLRNCIMLPGSRIETKDPKNNPPLPPFSKGGEGGLFIENCIISPGFKIELNESELVGLTNLDRDKRGFLTPSLRDRNVPPIVCDITNAILIGTGGSDRKYYRVKRYGHSAVLMRCTAGDTDFHHHIEYTRFFQRHSIPVPELIDVEPDRRGAFFEDLGDLSLYSWLKCQREQEEIEKIYRRVINVLVSIHTAATEHVSECPLLQNRIFDYEHLRWETGYFIERFVEGIRNVRVKNLSALNKEFHRLACKVDSFPKTIIHRDFQSQNIMITKGEIPRLVDYQGARIGPPAYDMVSILWDPYYRLEDDLRERLMNYYIDKTNKYNLLSPPFSKTLLPCRLQRHMQALGAYGFLSKIKGKKYFLKYVPEGIRLLKEDVCLSKDEYPRLYDLVMEL